MKRTQVLAVSFLVLLICSGIESYRIQKREAEDYLTQAKDFFSSTWGQVSSVADTVYEKVKDTGIPDKIQDGYTKATETLATYGNILADQFSLWFKNP